MNYHGVVSDAANPLKGVNYGYPACFAAWQTSNIPSNTGITIGSQFGGIAGTPYEQVTSRTSMVEVDKFCRTERQAPRIVFPARKYKYSSHSRIPECHEMTTFSKPADIFIEF